MFKQKSVITFKGFSRAKLNISFQEYAKKVREHLDTLKDMHNSLQGQKKELKNEAEFAVNNALIITVESCIKSFAKAFEIDDSELIKIITRIEKEEEKEKETNA